MSLVILKIRNKNFIIKENDKMENEQKIVEATKEKCVICGKETVYTVDTPISERQDYVKGVGQFCPTCYYEALIKKELF